MYEWIYSKFFYDKYIFILLTFLNEVYQKYYSLPKIQVNWSNDKFTNVKEAFTEINVINPDIRLESYENINWDFWYIIILILISCQTT